MSTNRPTKKHARIAIEKGTERIRSFFAHTQERPIIVLGNQKAGTSAIAHLLADYGRLSKTIDIRPLWPPLGVSIMRGEVEFANVVQRYRSYFASDLIKEPMMTFFADQVLWTFPEARYVFVIRDPRDNLRSLLNRRNIPGNLTEIPEHLVPPTPQHKHVVDPSVWGGEGENYVGVLAHRWNMASDSYRKHSATMTLAKYEGFCKDKVAFIGELAQKLCVSQERAIEDKVDIQYQPRGNVEMTWEEFFGPENLFRIERICGSRMSEFGYMNSNEQDNA